jgi:hypothetical protein
MPTGYTAELMEKGQDFDAFVMRCARAFGALITMRDESLEAPIPDEFQASTYASDALARAVGQRQRLEAMSNEERIRFGARERKNLLRSLKDAMAQHEAENVRLDDMAAKVKAWQPPSADHKELKAFMLEQIKTSRHDLTYYVRAMEEAEAKAPVTFYADAAIRAEKDIAYYTEELKKDQKRAAERTLWVKQLRDSLR